MQVLLPVEAEVEQQELGSALMMMGKLQLGPRMEEAAVPTDYLLLQAEQDRAQQGIHTHLHLGVMD